MDNGGCGLRKCRAGNKTVLSIEQAFGLSILVFLHIARPDLSFKSLTGGDAYCSYSKLREGRFVPLSFRYLAAAS